MKEVEERLAEIEAAWGKLGLDAKIARLEELTLELARPDAWSDSDRAQAMSKEMASLQKVVEPWVLVRKKALSAREFFELGDEESRELAEAELAEVGRDLEALRPLLWFSEPHDAGDAIVRLTAGVGGADAEDWTEMVERMYLRWAEKQGFSVAQVERQEGGEAGVKTSVFEVAGAYAYGKLRGEHGVHRLVRLSPFNADAKRQTSFALVEVLPVMDEAAVSIDPADLKIDVYRAGGHGGQSVNTTDSAVRVTHIPTGTVVAIQNERSQLKNKQLAMKVLLGKLEQLRAEQKAASLDELRAGESASWGQQIRNYVLHPYKLVKDTRTGYEVGDAEKVLDGGIDGFVEAYLSGAKA
ncbi:peptide chain release factor 2 [Candidatus Saccharibacteria bacterium]|nr:peptide chain release factor 2 [Candidatus Saccharibacteria bacterium]